MRHPWGGKPGLGETGSQRALPSARPSAEVTVPVLPGLWDFGWRSVICVPLVGHGGPWASPAWLPEATGQVVQGPSAEAGGVPGVPPR